MLKQRTRLQSVLRAAIILAAVLFCAAPGSQTRAQSTSPAAVAPAPTSQPASNLSTASVAPVTQPDQAAPLPESERRHLGKLSHSAGSASAGKDAASSNQSWLLTTMAALGVVIALILFLRTGLGRWLGRSTSPSRSPVLEVLTRVTVAPKNHVLLVRLGNRILVLGDSSAGLRTLANIDQPEEVASLLTALSAAKPTSATRDFANVFQGLNREFDQTQQQVEEGGDADEHRVDRARDRVSGLLARLRSTGRGGDA